MKNTNKVPASVLKQLVEHYDTYFRTFAHMALERMSIRLLDESDEDVFLAVENPLVIASNSWSVDELSDSFKNKINHHVLSEALASTVVYALNGDLDGYSGYSGRIAIEVSSVCSVDLYTLARSTDRGVIQAQLFVANENTDLVGFFYESYHSEDGYFHPTELVSILLVGNRSVVCFASSGLCQK